VGNFLGPNDSWVNIKKHMMFLPKEQVLELFNGKFEIVLFHEIEKDGTTGLGKRKHWHIYNIIAKKIMI
jgi:hypothetical protein